MHELPVPVTKDNHKKRVTNGGYLEQTQVRAECHKNGQRFSRGSAGALLFSISCLPIFIFYHWNDLPKNNDNGNIVLWRKLYRDMVWTIGTYKTILHSRILVYI